ncbi:MAG: porin [Patescibacteria group bacterium]|nr:porin [Patescibacteria group bacterium]
MKMVKSLLLGTAAGLVATAGAYAADLPVKAKPVQYVKVSSLYGTGFYYIPGADTVLKLDGGTVLNMPVEPIINASGAGLVVHTKTITLGAPFGTDPKYNPG